MTEGSWNAAIAGQFGVPVIMMSGDDAAIAEVRRAVGPIEAAETKRSLGAKDMVEASKIMTFLGEYRPDITP